MASYTVVVVPLRSSINSLDALRFFLWVKKLQELERERDSLWMGLQALEQARAWLCYKMEQNKQPWGLSPAALWAQLQGVNRTLHSVTYDPHFPAQTALRSPRSRGTPNFQSLYRRHCDGQF
ncbi:suppressor APC domain-containing protein 1-like [Colossoma macropomum]|uniref:suppressor APC domain-containing protein 1-like n=1 Tax=Colossoma macropomum TaxID=42526 RepID=UPI00186555B0|nr:suppressor APC domain-containing protein 1-like [Colossoma macropomum]